MKNVFLLFISLLLALPMKATGIILSELSNLSQLPTGELLCIFQDSEGYMWYGTDGGGLCRDDGYDIEIFRSDFNTPDLLESNSITCIAEDSKGRIWFGTRRGVYILDKSNYQIKPFPVNEIKGWAIRTIDVTSDGSIWILADKLLFRYNVSGERLGMHTIKGLGRIYEDHAGKIWMTHEEGLFLYDTHTDQFVSYHWPYEEHPTTIVKDTHTPFYWVGTWGKGIVRFNPDETESGKMFVVQEASTRTSDPDKKRINYIIQDVVKNYFWVTTADNLYAYELTEGATLRKVDTSSFLSEDKKILSLITPDRSGNLWITGYYPYSFTISFNKNEITNYPMRKAKEKFGVSASPMQLFYVDNYYWIRQKRLGLYTYSPVTKEFSLYENKYESSLFFEKSTAGSGVYFIKNGTTIVLVQRDGKRFIESEICNISIKTNERIRALHDDGNGNVWIGTTSYLLKYDLSQKHLQVICDDGSYINNIVSAGEKTYVATESKGFWEISGERRTYIHDSKENFSVLTVAPNQRVWIGTQQGNVYCYDPGDNSFIRETDECGLTGDVISDIESDDNGNIWIVTNQKITVYNPQKQTSDIIHSNDPSVNLENFLTIHKGAKGEMHIGGRGGIVVFPGFNQTEQTINESNVRLTSVNINNVQRALDRRNEKIILAPKERNLEMYFSTFDPLYANKIRYAFRYKQEGEYWNYLPVGQNRIILAELSKGNYEIEVRATDRNGLWGKNTTTVFVQRLPEWYETWWAYTIYFLTALLITLLVLHKYIDYQRNKHRLQMEEEVAQMKYRFFTNISHELRTPLTLIITPLETIIKKVGEANLRQQLESINKNAQNLLSLVNQLLDFRKIEMGGETLSLTKGDIGEFVSIISESFQLIAEEKGIDFIYQSEITSCYMFFDASKLQKVINNLLSNAFKFTGEGGHISLSVHRKTEEQADHVIISVEDTGRGIPEEEISTIFERFRQVDGEENAAGSGIGLHIVKEYVTMHNGSVSVKSELGKGTTFSVCIPANLEPIQNIVASTTEQIQVQEDAPVIPLTADLEKKILIVEDNPEFRAYLTNELSQFYTVYEAADGLEGEKEASEKEPDIIITDLMMPGMDGIELCHKIKNNIKTSHIPVILLTANNNVENEKRGYKEGADAYLSKPFHWDILLSRITNLMAQKVQRQQIFENELEVNPEDITISSLDEKLMKKALELIEANLNNSEYSIEDLSSDMCMSRSNLYRKIHSITGLTPTDFVRNIRLKKAAELLKRGELTVVEVAYSVGFNTPGYFTKSFKKMFGVLPTQYK